MNILFSEEKIAQARNTMHKNFRRKAFLHVKKIANRYLGFKPVPIKGKFTVPDFYADRSNRDKIVGPLEGSANAMISLANVYMITEEPKYCQKIVDLAGRWTNSVTGYGTDQAQYEANWNLQIMSVAISSVREIKDKRVEEFINYDYLQCLRLEKLNERSNNLRTWLGAHMIASAINKGDKKLFDRACELFKKTIREEVSEEGFMPKEVSRGNRGIHYTFFAIDALLFIAEAALNYGVNLYAFKQGKRSLLRAVEYILPYIHEPDKWPWSPEKQDFSIFPKYHSGWCEIAHRKWEISELKKFLAENRPIFDPRLGGAQTLYNGIEV